VAAKDHAGRDSFEIREPRFVAGTPPPADLELTVRIRHRHEGVAGTVRMDGERAQTRLSATTRGVAPGQACVFYDGEEVVGGGWIV